MPLGVVTPRTIEEAERAIALAREEGVTVLPRGGGSSQAGQTVNSSLVIDCSKHLTRILDLDVAGRRCRVEPGIVLDDLNRALKPHGLWFPVDVSTASRATIGGMTANNSCGGRSLRYGNTRENVLVDRRACWPTAARRISARSRRTCPTCRRFRRCGRSRAICSRSARARPTRSRRVFPRCSAGSAATTSTRWCRAQRPQPRAHPGRLGRHARRSPPRIELKLSPVLGRRAVGAVSFRQLPRGDGGGAAHRQARRPSRSSWSTRP